MAGGSASALSLSRPAQASLALRPIGSLSRPRRPLSRGSSLASYPTRPLASFRINRQLSGWNPPPLMIRAFGAHCQKPTCIESGSGFYPEQAARFGAVYGVRLSSARKALLVRSRASSSKPDRGAPGTTMTAATSKLDVYLAGGYGTPSGTHLMQASGRGQILVRQAGSAGATRQEMIFPRDGFAGEQTRPATAGKARQVAKRSRVA